MRVIKAIFKNSIVQILALALTTILIFGAMGVMIFNSAFPSNPVDDKKAEIAKERAKLRAEAVKQWQKEEMEQMR